MTPQVEVQQDLGAAPSLAATMTSSGAAVGGALEALPKMPIFFGKIAHDG